MRNFPPKVAPKGRARKCAYFACRKATVTDPLCAEHRTQEWLRTMYGLARRDGNQP